VGRRRALLALTVTFAASASVLVLTPSALAATVANNNDAGPGSLRDTITSASPGDTIVVPARTYTLTSGEITINKDLTINGAGAATTIVSGNNNSRVFNITSGTVSFSGLTITAGKVTGAGSNNGGAAIYKNGLGDLTVTDSSLHDNHADITGGSNNGGAAIYNNGAELTIIGTTIENNPLTVTSGTGNNGGAGVYNNGNGLTLTNSTVSSNTATLDDSSSNNGGGGLYNNGSALTLTGTRVDNNLVTLSGGAGNNNGGGGIYNNGSNMTLTESSASGNTADLTVVDGTNNGGGGVYNNGSVLTLTRSTVGANGLTLTGAENNNGGGGIYNNGSSVPFTNSTVSANTATVNAGATLSGGGGLYNNGSDGTFTNATIANNSINLPGGGVFNNGSLLTLKNTILANNAASAGANCSATFTPAFHSSGNNLESADTCSLGAGERRNTNPLLGPLANNGGPTQTQALAAGSPAIDHADNSACPATDQRGVARPFPAGGTCDIGAFEFVPAAVAQVGAPATQCVRRPISLVRADVVGNKVRLEGLVQPQFAGQVVTILGNGSAKAAALTKLGKVKANAAGQFRATVKRPPRKRLNSARYQAQVSRFRSIPLKLPQSLRSSSVRVVGGQIELRGNVNRKLLGRRNTVVVKRLVCGRYRTVGRARPNRKGNYVARFPVPANVTVALFRAETEVLTKPRGRRYVKQYARAISITLTNQTG
jgi:hypothetical protein